jgi:integrase
MAYINSKKYGSTVQHYKKANGDISYYITYKDEHNKLKRIKIGDKSKGITEPFCNQKRNEIVNKIRLGEEVPIKHKKSKQFTLQNAYDEYIKWAMNNKSSWKNNDEAMYNKHLKEPFGDRSLISLKPQDFEDLKQEKLKDGYKPRTVVLILGIARHTINYAINNELIKNYLNPIANGRVKMPTIDNSKTGFLDKEQARELIEILEQRDEPLAYQLTILLLYTGARFSEVASLTWNDINFKENLIYFKATKNGNARSIKITSKVLEILNELAENKISHLIIPSSNGKQIIQMPKQWQTIVDNLIPNNIKADKNRITVHSLRHTHASWLAISGMNILEIKEQLGHKKLDMTLRYSHLIPSARYQKTIDVFQNI